MLTICAAAIGPGFCTVKNSSIYSLSAFRLACHGNSNYIWSFQACMAAGCCRKYQIQSS